MEICKAPTLRLKALNKHSITHIMYVKMEMYQQWNVYKKKRKKEREKKRKEELTLSNDSDLICL